MKVSFAYLYYNILLFLFFKMDFSYCKFLTNIRVEQHFGARGWGTPLFGLYGDVPLDRVSFFGLAVLNKVYNLFDLDLS